MVIRLLGLVAGIFTVAVQGRALGAADFATLSMLLAIASTGQTLVDLGLGKVATQRIAADPSTAPKVVGSVLVARLALGVIAALVGTVIGGTITGDGTGYLAALLVCVGLPLSSVTVLQALSEARLEVWIVNAVILTQNGVWLALVFGIYLAKGGLLLFAAGYATAAVIQAIVVWLLCVRGIPFSIRGMRKHAWHLLRSAIPLGLGAIAVTAYYRLTGVILFARTGADSSAGYFAAMRLIDAGQVLPATIGGVLLPLLSHSLHRNDRKSALATWDLAVRVQLISSAAVTGITVVYSSAILGLLFGRDFSSHGIDLSILIFAYLPSCLGWIVTSALIAAGELRAYSATVIFVAVLSLFILMIGIGHYRAAWAEGVTVGTEWLCVGALTWIAARRVHLAIDPSVVLRVFVLGTVVAGACLLSKGAGLGVGALVAALVAATLTIVLQLVSVPMVRSAVQLKTAGRDREATPHAS